MAARTKADLAKRVELLKARGIQPGLGTILVGSDPGSVKYVAGKHADCAEIGVNSIKRELPENATFDQVVDAVRQLNADPACTGYIVQLPLPRGIDENAIIDLIDPKKDADGMHPYNLGELVLHARGDIATPLPCTPRGVIELLRAYDIDLDGKEVCVLGRGITIGRTIGLLLTRKAVTPLSRCAIREPRMCVNTCDGRCDRRSHGSGWFRQTGRHQGSRFSSTSEYPACSTRNPADTRSRVMSIKPVTRRLWHIRRILERRADDACHAVAECRGDGRTSVVSFAIVLSGVS